MRLMRLFATAAVIAGSIVGFAAPASADPLCEQAWLRGELVTPTDLGQCVPPYNAPWCDFEHVGIGDQLNVYVNLCIPVV